MLNKIDNLLNSITMYRLVLYYLILLIVTAFLFSVFHLLPFSPTALIFSTAVLLSVCYLVNKFFAKIFKVQGNFESLYITALILVLIITPQVSIKSLEFLSLAAFLSMASKYIFNIKRKHIFNPAAIAVVITALTIGGYASWWIATKYMFPFLLPGVLIARKVRQTNLVFYFLVASIASSLALFFARGNFDIIQNLKLILIDSPVLFFAFVMLTEPQTYPPSPIFQGIYGGLVGILFSPIHFGAFYTTPEIALSIGNIFSYIVSPKQKLVLSLKEKIELTDRIYDFIFSTKEKLNFEAGQYLEWTLGHKNPDTRGNRRYLTVASSPTEDEIRIGVKFPQNSSSYKKEMLQMKKWSKITVSQLSGEFTLPKNKNQKLAFIAGGIGITPFRSIVKYLTDINEKRDITLMYSDKVAKDFVYKDIFNEAAKKFGIKVFYIQTSIDGRINSDMIKKYMPDYKERKFYLSGPHEMVVSIEEILSEMKLPKNMVKVDYFSGY